MLRSGDPWVAPPLGEARVQSPDGGPGPPRRRATPPGVVAHGGLEDPHMGAAADAGAVGSPTRHSHRKGSLPTCIFYDARLGSLRHLWQDCPRWTTERTALALEFGVALRWWWADQPRVTSKSGWITFGAADTTKARAGLQIMTCRLGILVVRALHCYRDQAALDVSGVALRLGQDLLGRH